MAFLASTVIDAARRMVLDTRAPSRYANSYYIDGINESFKTIAEMKPVLFGTTSQVDLVAGARQELTEDRVIEFMDVLSVTAADATVSNPTPVAGYDLRSMDRSWESREPDDVAYHFFPGTENRRAFYLYPPRPTTPGVAEVHFSQFPVLISDPADMVQVQNELYSAITNYVAAYVLRTDDEDPTTTQKAEKFFQAFVALISPTGTANDG